MSDIKKYHNVRELAEEMYQCAKAGKYASAVVFYDTAVSLLHCLMCDYSLNPVSIDLSSFEYCGYDKEYYVSIVDDNGLDFKDIIVEKANYEGIYLSTDADYIFIDGDASSKIIIHTPLENYTVFDKDFSSDDEDDYICEDSEMTAGNNEYTLIIPEGTGASQWQGQFVFNHTGIKISTDKTYDFQVTLYSEADHPHVTVKPCYEQAPSNDVNELFYKPDIVLSAYEEYVYTVTGLPGTDIPDMKLVFDFGGAVAGSKVIVSGITIIEH